MVKPDGYGQDASDAKVTAPTVLEPSGFNLNMRNLPASVKTQRR